MVLYSVIDIGSNTIRLVVYRVDEEEFIFDTAVIREAVGGLPLNEPEIIAWIGQYIAEGIGEVELSRAGR